MKTIPIALAAHYQQPCTTIAGCLKVTRADGVVVGFTTTDKVLEIDGVTYQPGFDLSSLVASESLAVDNMELRFLALDEYLPLGDLLAGLWNNAAFEVFSCNYMAPSDGVDIHKVGTTGEVQIKQGVYVIEFRSLAQALQQTQGIVTSKTCRARLGDAKCMKDLTDFTFTSTFTAVASTRLLTDSTRAEADDFFVDGLLAVTSGAAAGLSQKVKAFADGVFTLSLPLPYLPELGDAYTVIAGCRKRLEEDCASKFDNVLNFQGEPHLPGLDKLTRPATSDAQPEGTPALPLEEWES